MHIAVYASGLINLYTSGLSGLKAALRGTCVTHGPAEPGLKITKP